MIFSKEYKKLHNIGSELPKEEKIKLISKNEIILNSIKNISLSFIVIGLIFLVIGIIFIPLSIVTTVREVYFNYFSLEAIILYISFFLFIVFFSVGLFNLIKQNKIRKREKLEK